MVAGIHRTDAVAVNGIGISGTYYGVRHPFHLETLDFDISDAAAHPNAVPIRSDDFGPRARRRLKVNPRIGTPRSFDRNAFGFEVLARADLNRVAGFDNRERLRNRGERPRFRAVARRTTGFGDVNDMAVGGRRVFDGVEFGFHFGDAIQLGLNDCGREFVGGAPGFGQRFRPDFRPETQDLHIGNLGLLGRKTESEGELRFVGREIVFASEGKIVALPMGSEADFTFIGCIPVGRCFAHRYG